MKTSADKTLTKSQSVPNAVQQRGSDTSGRLAAAVHAEATAQRKLQDSTNESPPAKTFNDLQEAANSSEHVSQLRAYQAMADGRPVQGNPGRPGLTGNGETGRDQAVNATTEVPLQLRSAELPPAAQASDTKSIVQLAVDWNAVPTTAGGNYAISPDQTTLYSKPGAAAPEPAGLYTKGADVTTDLAPVALSTWKPNVRFLSGAAITKDEVIREERKGEPDPRSDKRILLEELYEHYTRMRGQVNSAMRADPGEGASPTIGVIGKNDCDQWATELQTLILKARGDVAAEAPVEYDLGKGAEPDLSGAPALRSGDRMVQELGRGAGSLHHGATIVATDGGSVVTLEAHVEKDLPAPEFHIHAGLPGFIDTNNAGSEGANMYLQANGRKGKVDPLGSAQTAINNRLAMLDYYADELGGVKDEDRLALLQEVLKWYEEVLPEARALVAAPEEPVPAEPAEPKKAEPKKGCFLTTACVSYYNLPDDCEELTVLRAFRDQYMLRLPGGQDLVRKYYEVAPGIVQKIDRAANRRDIYEELYRILRECVQAIKAGDNKFALKVYKEMVISLERRFR